jgi:hypothetical protein
LSWFFTINLAEQFKGKPDKDMFSAITHCFIPVIIIGLLDCVGQSIKVA